MRWFVVKQTRWLVVQAKNEREALDDYARHGKEMRSAAGCTHAEPIEVESLLPAEQAMEPFKAWEQAEIIGADR